MDRIEYTGKATDALDRARQYCRKFRHEFIMPEHLLLSLLEDEAFALALEEYGDMEDLDRKLRERLGMTESIPCSPDYEPNLSVQMVSLLKEALSRVVYSSAEELDITHLADALLSLDDSWAA